MANLESIKHQFDIAITHLNLFFPLISLTNKKSMENKDFGLLKEAIQTFNLNYAYYTIGNVTIDKIVSDSKLFLQLHQRRKFYRFAHDEIMIRKNQLDTIISQMNSLSSEEITRIESIFSEHFNPAISGFPRMGSIEQNTNFVNELVSGTRSYFNNFISQIDRIKPKTKVTMQSANQDQEEAEEGVTYLYKNGKQMMSAWKFFTQTGTLERFEKAGMSMNPVHNFELLKPYRLEKFKAAKKLFIEEREINEVKTGEFEINALLYSWLKSELNVIADWLSDTYPNGEKKKAKTSTSDQIEILKYKQFATSEMQRLEDSLNPTSKPSLISKKSSEPISEDTNSIRTRLEIAFAFMRELDPRQHQIILDETDFQDLINWVSNYFENNFCVPTINNPIRKIRTNKGNVFHAFKLFFREEYPSGILPDSLFELIKACFYEYREDKIENFKKAKEPQYYKHLAHKIVTNK